MGPGSTYFKGLAIERYVARDQARHIHVLAQKGFGFFGDGLSGDAEFLVEHVRWR